MSNFVVEASQLGHRYRGGSEDVLEQLDFQIAPGEMVGFYGNSGCGKTTLLLIAGGLLKPSSGSIKVDGVDMFALNPIARAGFRNRKVGFLFQTLELIPYLTLHQNVMLSKNVTKAEANSLLERLGLRESMSRKPESVSHGQRQRAALARAIAHQPRIVIADEPTGNLDEENSQLVFDVLREYSQSGGSVLVASHDSNWLSQVDRQMELGNSNLSKPSAASTREATP